MADDEDRTGRVSARLRTVSALTRRSAASSASAVVDAAQAWLTDVHDYDPAAGAVSPLSGIGTPVYPRTVSKAEPGPVHIHVWKAPEVLPEVQECPCGELRVTPRPQGHGGNLD